MDHSTFKLRICDLRYANSTHSLIQSGEIRAERGGILGLKGRSGVGKSSLFEWLAGLGKRGLKGKVQWSPSSPRVALMPQQPRLTLHPTQSALQSIRDIRKGAGKTSELSLEEILGMAALDRSSSILERYPHELSGGEVQRVAFAMSLAMGADWLLLDEPTASLDRVTAGKVIHAAVEWCKDRGKVCWISSHESDLLQKYCDVIYEVGGQEIKKAGAPERAEHYSSLAPKPDEHQELETLYSISDGKFSRQQRNRNFTLQTHLRVRENDILGISGRSGAGKSTLGKLIGGQLKWRSGKERWQTDAAPGERVQYVGQDPLQNFHPYRKIGDQLLPIFRRWVQKDAQQRDVEEYMEEVWIPPDWFNLSIRQLSGGQRQKVMLSRALLPKPACLIMDETTSALDQGSTVEIMNWLLERKQRLGFALILISHDIPLLLKCCRKVLFLDEGRVVDEVKPNDFIKNRLTTVTKELVDAYY